MNVYLKEFQEKAISELINAFEKDNKNIILQSCTGSGKTIIITNFIDEILKISRKYVFIWLTPGAGNLEEQSMDKMKKNVPGRKTKNLRDVLIDGFSFGDTCFINWELLTNKTNIATKQGDFKNIFDHIDAAKNEGVSFVIIIDEEHLNQTIKSQEVINFFDPFKIIRASATPKYDSSFTLVSIDEDDVIASELIKKKIIVNLGIESNVKVDNQIDYLLQQAIEKRNELQQLYNENCSEPNQVNPLIIVQLPNNNDNMLNQVEDYFYKKNMTYENGLLSVWLSGKVENIDNISKNNDFVQAIIIKQAISTGWDCPRAQILVKLRSNMDERFEIQTLGRIRRMPEVKFYDDDKLNYCYLYTFDSKYVQEVKENTGNKTLEAKYLILKDDELIDDFCLNKELKTVINYGVDSRQTYIAIYSFLKNKYHLSTKKQNNKIRLEANGFVFENDIVKNILKGSVTKLDKREFKHLQSINMVEPLNTHTHGHEFHHVLGEFAKVMHLQYNETRVIIRRLFDEKKDNKNQLLSLSPQQLYAFCINNFYTLRNDFTEALTYVHEERLGLVAHDIKNIPFSFPKKEMFTYDSSQKFQKVYSKNVYSGYLSSAEVRSNSEKRFEKYCENCSNVRLFYKNGDKGVEYFSIVYENAFGKQMLFYPDYLVIDKNNQIWIIETKGGFTRTGKSEDIDKFSPLKFAVLKNYLDKYKLHGGFVRLDKKSDELCICYNEYSDNIESKEWHELSEVL